MERVILGYPVIHLYKCCGKKFFAGKQGPHVIFLFYQQPGSFCDIKIVVQFPAYAFDEYAEFVTVYIISWQSIGKNAAFYRIGFTRWMEPQPCFQFFGGNCCKSTAECCDHGSAWVPAYHSTTDLADAAIKSSFCAFDGNTFYNNTVARST